MDTNSPTAEFAGLFDLTRLPLRELWSLEDATVLGHSLQRAVGDAEKRPKDAVSAFNSAI